MQTIDHMIERLWEIRETRRELSQQDQALASEYAALEATLMETMSASGIQAARTNKALASVSNIEITTVNDWDAFYQYIRENDAFYLLQKRPATSACKEINTLTGTPVPGTSSLSIKKVNLTKNKGT